MNGDGRLTPKQKEVLDTADARGTVVGSTTVIDTLVKLGFVHMQAWHEARTSKATVTEAGRRVASCGVTPKDSGPRWGDPVTNRCECGINDHDHALCQKSRPVAEVTEPLAKFAVCAYCLKFWRARHWVTDYGPQGYAVRYLETSL